MNNTLKAPTANTNKDPEAPVSQALQEESSTATASQPEAVETADTPSDDDSVAENHHIDKAVPSHHACPMFSHECVIVPGEDAIDDDVPITPPDVFPTRRFSDRKSHEYAQDPDIDVDNPLLERFPSDSAAIFATIRRLSSSVDEDRAFPQGIAPSSIMDPSKPSPADGPLESQSLTVPQASQHPHGEQQSHGERRKRSISVSGGSVSSLNAITEDEDERPDDERSDDERPDERPDDELAGFPSQGTTPADQTPALLTEQPQAGDEEEELVEAVPNGAGGPVERPGPAPKSAIKVESPASDDDEGIAMCNASRERPAGGNLDSADLLISEPAKHLHKPYSHIVEPPLCSPTPEPEEDRFDAAETALPNGLAVNHVREASPDVVVPQEADDRDANPSEHDNEDGLRKRNIDRPISRVSIHKTLPEVTQRANWLTAFLHLLFVDWIGGSLSRLWRGKQMA